MTAPAGEATTRTDRLENFPVTFFAVTMGLGGFALALRAVETGAGWPHVASVGVLLAAGLAFVAIAALYAAKAFRHPAAVRTEWSHPVRIAFFPAASISLLLLATAGLPHAGLAGALWVAATALQGVLTLAVIAGWVGTRGFQTAHVSPAWFIPAVGNVVVPIAGAGLGHAELSWLFLSGGLMFWLVLLTLVMNRLIFHDPLPSRLLPTLAILIAPPAVGFLAYVSLTGGVDSLARILLNAAYVFALVVVTQVPKLIRLPFALSWWALSFPVAALTLASFRYGELTGSPFHAWLGFGLGALLAAIMAVLLWRTAAAIAAGKVCVPEG